MKKSGRWTSKRKYWKHYFLDTVCLWWWIFRRQRARSQVTSPDVLSQREKREGRGGDILEWWTGGMCGGEEGGRGKQPFWLKRMKTCGMSIMNISWRRLKQQLTFTQSHSTTNTSSHHHRYIVILFSLTSVVTLHNHKLIIFNDNLPVLCSDIRPGKCWCVTWHKPGKFIEQIQWISSMNSQQNLTRKKQWGGKGGIINCIYLRRLRLAWLSIGQ